MSKKNMSLAISYWLIAALFYFYQYVLRVSGGVLTDTLMLEFELTATTVGTVLSVASFSYVIMQIPSGVLTDYFGVRSLLPIVILLCALGCALFAHTTSYGWLLVARALIGFGAAFAFISCSKVISIYFSEKRLPMMVSWTILIGSAGGLVGAGPLSRFIDESGWRPSLFYIAFIGVGLSLLSMLMGLQMKRVVPLQSQETVQKKLLDGLRYGLKSKPILLVCLWGFCIYMPICVFADTWGVPFLMEATGCTKTAAASHVSLIYLGLIIGCPIFGWLGTQTSRYDIIFSISSGMLLILFSLLIWKIALIAPWIESIMILIGFFISVQLLMFPAAVRHAPIPFTASTVGLVNTTTMVSGALFQKLVGLGVDAFWDGSYCEGIPKYSSFCYQMPLSIILVLMFMATLTALFIRDKKAR